ncbi:MAG: hypothetical protein RIG77_06115 [Cyclobacteriaceae bacterium]
MDIRDQLFKEHSKENAQYIARYIGNDADKFHQLIELFLGNDHRVTQKASWVLSMVSDTYPDLLSRHLDAIISNLENEVNDAVKRNTLRILQNHTIPEKHEGFIANKCFDYLLSNQEPIAIKAFSMTILANLTVKYPDFKQELKTIVEDLMEHGSPGIKARGKMVLKKLGKLV